MLTNLKRILSKHSLSLMSVTSFSLLLTACGTAQCVLPQLPVLSPPVQVQDFTGTMQNFLQGSLVTPTK